jgi:hypothetical protein
MGVPPRPSRGAEEAEMRVWKLFATPVAAFALFAGTAAVAGDLATLDSFCAVNSNPCMTMLCVVPSPTAVGRVCNVSANGLPVASIVLAPGNNFVGAPSFGPATNYVASGPGIQAKSILEEGLGLN